MNTSAKGSAFEEEIFQLFKSLIDQGKFWAASNCCEVFLRKPYYSADRCKNIIFDVTVEIKMLGKSEPSVVVFIECKNYSHPVPVNDVEEFWSKVQQVSGANAKAIFVTNAALQEGTLNFAKAKKFGLIRYFSRSNFKWELTRSPSAFGAPQVHTINDQLYRAMTSQDYKSDFIDCYCFVSGSLHFRINFLFERLCLELIESLSDSDIALLLNPEKEAYQSVKYLAKDEISNVAKNCLSNVGYKVGRVDLDNMCKWLRESQDLEVEIVSCGTDQGRTLGTISFCPLKISIFEDAHSNDEQQRFTLGHEFGHLMLGHKEYLRKEKTGAASLNTLNDPGDDNLSKDIRRLEWQANYFASCLLLPQESLVEALFILASKFRIYDKGFGLLYLDDQQTNLNSYNKVINQLKFQFGASKAAITYRLKDLGYLTDARRVSNEPFDLPNGV